MTGTAEQLDLAAVQRHTVRTLVVSQAIGAVGVTIGVATASLLARDLSGSVVDSMAVLLLGAVLLGATTAVNNGSRYAATDLATEEHRARALSVVVWATTVGAASSPSCVTCPPSGRRSSRWRVPTPRW